MKEKSFLNVKDVRNNFQTVIFNYIPRRKNIDRRREKFGYESVSTMGLSVAGADVMQVCTQ